MDWTWSLNWTQMTFLPSFTLSPHLPIFPSPFYFLLSLLCPFLFLSLSSMFILSSPSFCSWLLSLLSFLLAWNLTKEVENTWLPKNLHMDVYAAFFITRNLGGSQDVRRWMDKIMQYIQITDWLIFSAKMKYHEAMKKT